MKNEYYINIWEEVVVKKSMTVKASSREEAKQMILDAVEAGEAPWAVADEYDSSGRVVKSSSDFYLTESDGEDEEFIGEFCE